MLVKLNMENSMQWHSTNGSWALVTMGPSSLATPVDRCLRFSAEDHLLHTEALQDLSFLLDYQKIPTSLTPDQVWILPITSKELHLEEEGRSWPLEPGWFEFHLSYMLAVWPWTSFLTSLGFQFFICTMGITVTPTSWIAVRGQWAMDGILEVRHRCPSSFPFASPMYSKTTLSPEAPKKS